MARVKFLLSGIFVSAVNAGLCDVNPITEVELPDGRAEGRITGAYELREVLGMLGMPCFSLEARAAIGVAGFAGLRESEMAALCWADYDGSDIHVRHSRDRVSKELLSTKTEKSKASVPVIAPLSALLDTYRNGAKPGAPIFMIDLDRLGRKIIKPVIEAAGLRWRGWHGFRRGLASNLKALGVDDLVIQRVLRHSNVEVTRQSYVKIRDEQVAAAMARLDAAIEQCTVVVQSK